MNQQKKSSSKERFSDFLCQIEVGPFLWHPPITTFSGKGLDFTGKILNFEGQFRIFSTLNTSYWTFFCISTHKNHILKRAYTVNSKCTSLSKDINSSPTFFEKIRLILQNFQFFQYFWGPNFFLAKVAANVWIVIENWVYCQLGSISTFSATFAKVEKKLTWIIKKIHEIA